MSYAPAVNQRRRKRQRLFTKDIEQLLFSLGDPSYGEEATVNALEDALVEFLTDLCHNALQYARSHGRNKVKIEDFYFALRNDPMKLARIEYIIKQNQRITRDKKAFNTYDEKNLAQHAMQDEVEPPMPKKKRGRKKREETHDDDDDDEEENEDDSD